MPYYCTVPRCTSMAGKAKNVSFHQFPRDEELAKLWNKILKRGKPYTKYSKVCSLHFTPEDYTITSVGKNKGQWRTLRKDAIPSQNLPSESPTPYQRKQWGSWSHSTPANILDPTIQQQVAQAIYMQTMLAMHAAGAAEIPTLTHSNGLPQLPASTGAFPHTSNTPDLDILKGKQTNTNEKSTSYKCTECSKCFKDPDVFILHKRSHINNEKNEKENFNLNLTLQANPILANLLKTNTENANIFDGNVFSMESLLMTALAANMEGYMRSFTSMIKNENGSDLNHERGDLSHDRGSLVRDRNDLNHDRGNLGDDRDRLSHDRGSLGRDRDDLSDDRGSLEHDGKDLSPDRGILGCDGDDLSHNRGSMSHFGRQERLSINCRSSLTPNGDQSSQRGNHNRDRSKDNDRGIINHDKGEINHDRDNMDHDGGRSNLDRETDTDLGAGTGNGDRTLFRDKIIELYRSNDRNIRYYENNHDEQDSVVTNYNERGVTSSNRRPMGNDRGTFDNDSAMMGDDTVSNGDDINNDDGDKTDDDSQGIDGPICDSDFSESIDSNKLVIDETI